jgi:hypothetical protein
MDAEWFPRYLVPYRHSASEEGRSGEGQRRQPKLRTPVHLRTCQGPMPDATSDKDHRHVVEVA